MFRKLRWITRVRVTLTMDGQSLGVLKPYNLYTGCFLFCVKSLTESPAFISYSILFVENKIEWEMKAGDSVEYFTQNKKHPAYSHIKSRWSKVISEYVFNEENLYESSTKQIVICQKKKIHIHRKWEVFTLSPCQGWNQSQSVIGWKLKLESRDS